MNHKLKLGSPSTGGRWKPLDRRLGGVSALHANPIAEIPQSGFLPCFKMLRRLDTNGKRDSLMVVRTEFFTGRHVENNFILFVISTTEYFIFCHKDDGEFVNKHV